jgi:hypothetical protein
VVIDDVGHYEGIAAAEAPCGPRGAEVHFVTPPTPRSPHQMEAALSAEPALQRLARGRFTLHLRTRALAIGHDDVELLPGFLPAGGPGAFRVPADRVVFISHNQPNRDLGQRTGRRAGGQRNRAAGGRRCQLTALSAGGNP